MHLCKCLVEFNKLKKHVTKLVTLIFSWKKNPSALWRYKLLMFIDIRGEV